MTSLQEGQRFIHPELEFLGRVVHIDRNQKYIIARVLKAYGDWPDFDDPTEYLPISFDERVIEVPKEYDRLEQKLGEAEESLKTAKEQLVSFMKGLCK